MSEQPAIVYTPVASFVGANAEAEAETLAKQIGGLVTTPAGMGSMKQVVLGDAEGKHTPRWGHMDIPEGYVLTRRDQVRVGDEVISSHFGDQIVRNARSADGTTELIFTPPDAAHMRNERYASHGFVPCRRAANSVSVLPEADRALVAVETLDRLATFVENALGTDLLDLGLARALLAQMHEQAQVTHASLVKDLGRSDQIAAFAGRSAREHAREAVRARHEDLTFEEDVATRSARWWAIQAAAKDEVKDETP